MPYGGRSTLTPLLGDFSSLLSNPPSASNNPHPPSPHQGFPWRPFLSRPLSRPVSALPVTMQRSPDAVRSQGDPACGEVSLPPVEPALGRPASPGSLSLHDEQNQNEPRRNPHAAARH